MTARCGVERGAMTEWAALIESEFNLSSVATALASAVCPSFEFNLWSTRQIVLLEIGLTEQLATLDVSNTFFLCRFCKSSTNAVLVLLCISQLTKVFNSLIIGEPIRVGLSLTSTLPFLRYLATHQIPVDRVLGAKNCCWSTMIKDFVDEPLLLRDGKVMLRQTLWWSTPWIWKTCRHRCYWCDKYDMCSKFFKIANWGQFFPAHIVAPHLNHRIVIYSLIGIVINIRSY